MSGNDKILIIGNGPSARELADVGFDRLRADVDTFGMGIAYRSKDEVEEWKQRDAIRLLEGQLAEQDVLSIDAAAAIHERVRAEALEAIEWAEASPYPAVDDLLADVYYDGN